MSLFRNTVEDVRETFEDIHDVAKDTRSTIQEGLSRAKDAIEDVTDVISEKVEDIVDDVQEVLGISKVENRLIDWIDRTALARRVLVRGGLGGAMLFYGVHFSHLVVFAHTIRITGWPFIERAWNEVIDMYVNARATIKVRKRSIRQGRVIISHFVCRHCTERISQSKKESKAS